MGQLPHDTREETQVQKWSLLNGPTVMTTEPALELGSPDSKLLTTFIHLFVHQAYSLYLIQCKVLSSGLETKEEKKQYFPIMMAKTIYQVPPMCPWMRHFRSVMSFSLRKTICEVGTISSL